MARRTCCDCGIRRDAVDGFDTHRANVGPVWLCWPCYFEATGRGVRPSRVDDDAWTATKKRAREFAWWAFGFAATLAAGFLCWRLLVVP